MSTPASETILVEEDDYLEIPTLSNAALPQMGDLHCDTEDGQILVYAEGDGGPAWMPVHPPRPKWVTKYYAMRGTDGIIKGIFKTPVDESTSYFFDLQDGDDYMTLEAEEIDASDYDTHIAFETFPVLEKEMIANGNAILLKYPE